MFVRHMFPVFWILKKFYTEINSDMNFFLISKSFNDKTDEDTIKIYEKVVSKVAIEY